MKKQKLTKIFISIIAAILIVVVFKDGLSTNNTSEETDNGIYTVTLVNVDESCGDLVLAVKDGDTYVDQTSNTIEVEKGTKIKAYFPEGINSGEEILYWTINSGGVMKYVASTSEDSDYYNEDKFVKTIDSDLTIYLFTKPENVETHTVTFYDTAVESKRNLIGISIVKDGEAANLNGVIVQTRTGFDADGYSKDLSCVTSDMDVYPVFTSNIYTIFRDYHSMFMSGLLVTLLLSVISVALAMFFGVLICLVRMSDNKFFGTVAAIYVEIIRGVPLLLQLLLIYVLLGPTKISIGSFFTTEVIACILTMTINSSAYSSEIFRSGIQAVDKGQMEAGRALGMSKWQVYKKIVIPQGLKNALPSIVNELVAMIKETSLAVSVDASIGELMSVRKNITAATYVNLPPYIIVAIIYFCVTFSLSKCVGVLEKRLNSRD